MKKKKIQILWFKKNLRIRDNQMLSSFDPKIPTLCVYFFEPSILKLVDTGAHQMQFILDSLGHLEKDLRSLHLDLVFVEGEVVPFFNKLRLGYEIVNIFSHEETGNMQTYKRDIEVYEFCSEQDIDFIEFPTNGVVRRLGDRDIWSHIWNERIVKSPEFLPKISQSHHDFGFSNVSSGVYKKYRKKYTGNDVLQKGGEQYGLCILKDFLEKRGKNYSYDIGKPGKSRYSCSRLSPYIAIGALSLKTIYAETKRYQQRLGLKNTAGAKAHKRALTTFLSRIHWQSHFIQKLEDEPSIEYENLNKEFDAIRQKANTKIIDDFFLGMTGIPYIDATMRQLQAIGWCNFRSRAIIISFICNTCMQPWQAVSKRLAALFCDYEPGIHYSQIQMQAGTSGINTIRIYNPVKNGKDKDPDGEWIRQWIPELRNVPTLHIHEPHLWEDFQTLDYPSPSIDMESSNRHAREVLWGTKKKTSRDIKNKIYKKHGSRSFKRLKSSQKKLKATDEKQLTIGLKLDTN